MVSLNLRGIWSHIYICTINFKPDDFQKCNSTFYLVAIQPLLLLLPRGRKGEGERNRETKKIILYIRRTRKMKISFKTSIILECNAIRQQNPSQNWGIQRLYFPR